MEEKKLKLQFEFSESEVKGVSFLLDEELSPEDWNGITEKPIAIKFSELSDDESKRKQVTIILITLALRLYKENEDNK
ncbi:MAG: hypothetical protein Q4E59_00545 [Bacteroidales bacterium]|nr:hypothetical protein [Bacteroidales bacterium]